MLAVFLSTLSLPSAAKPVTEIVRVGAVDAELCGVVEKQETEKASSFSLKAFYSHQGKVYCAVKVYQRANGATREQFWVDADKAIEGQWKRLGYSIERKSLRLDQEDTTISTSVIGSRSYLEGRDREGKPTAVIVIHHRDYAVMLDVSVLQGTQAQARNAVEQLESSVRVK